MHANHMHVEQTRSKATTLTTAQIMHELGSPFVPQIPTEDDEMRRAVMVPGSKPAANGRWPFWMLTATGEDIVSCNGAPALAGGGLVQNIPVAPIPKPHRPIIGIEPAPDGNGVIVCRRSKHLYIQGEVTEQESTCR